MNQKNSINKIGKLIAGIIVIIAGALLLADAVTTLITTETLFFSEINRGFEFIIGFIFVILGASVMDDSR